MWVLVLYLSGFLAALLGTLILILFKLLFLCVFFSLLVGKFTRVFNSCLNMWITNVVGWIGFLSRLGCKAADSIHIRKRGYSGASLSVYGKYVFLFFFWC